MARSGPRELCEPRVAHGERRAALLVHAIPHAHDARSSPIAHRSPRAPVVGLPQAQRLNVRITLENLKAYYEKHDPENPRDDEKLKAMIEKAGGEDGGPGHHKLYKALRKKYGKGPKTVKRVVKESPKKSRKKVPCRLTRRPLPSPARAHRPLRRSLAAHPSTFVPSFSFVCLFSFAAS